MYRFTLARPLCQLKRLAVTTYNMHGDRLKNPNKVNLSNCLRISRLFALSGYWIIYAFFIFFVFRAYDHMYADRRTSHVACVLAGATDGQPPPAREGGRGGRTCSAAVRRGGGLGGAAAAGPGECIYICVFIFNVFSGISITIFYSRDILKMKIRLLIFCLWFFDCLIFGLFVHCLISGLFVHCRLSSLKCSCRRLYRTPTREFEVRYDPYDPMYNPDTCGSYRWVPFHSAKLAYNLPIG